MIDQGITNISVVSDETQPNVFWLQIDWIDHSQCVKVTHDGYKVGIKCNGSLAKFPSEHHVKMRDLLPAGH
jgi:hypothetical protein